MVCVITLAVPVKGDVRKYLLLFAVPIIPEYLYQLDHPEHAAGNFSSNHATTRPPLTTPAIWIDSSDYEDQYSSTLPLTTLRPTRRPPRTRPTTPTTTAVTNLSTLSPEDAELRHEELVEVNVRVGLLFASKAAMQLLVNPFVGHITNK